VNLSIANSTAIHDTAPKSVAANEFKAANFRYYEYFLAAFVVILMISNLVGQKLVEVDFRLPFSLPFTGDRIHLLFSSANLMFPLTYIFGDVFTEVYGYAGSRRAIWMGFFANILMSLILVVMVALPPAASWPNQPAFETVFTQIPRLVVASLIAFWAGEFANSFVMARMKVMTRGKWLFARVVGSTAVGQLVDTVVLMVVAFGGTQPWDNLIVLIYSGYISKVIYEALMYPVTDRVVAFLKKSEGVDVYDDGTDFTPFHL
jgi:queuosine precursor transporter